MDSKCWLGARGRALRARPRAPMLVVPWCCYLAATQRIGLVGWVADWLACCLSYCFTFCFGLAMLSTCCLGARADNWMAG